MNKLITTNEIEQEVKQYRNIANTVTGFFLITLFLGALSTDNPLATAYLLLPLAFSSYFIMGQYYPSSFIILEKMLKDENYKNDKQEIQKTLNKLKKKSFNSKMLLSKNIIYLYGSILYFSLLIPDIGLSIKSGSWCNWCNTLFLTIKSFVIKYIS